MLVLAMVLTKKIVNTVPFLLRRVFDTTVNYMNRQFHNYIVDMVSAVKLLCGSHSQPFSCPGLFPEGWPSSGLPVACWFPCSALEVGPEGNASPCRALEMSVLQGVMSHLLAPPPHPSEQPMNRVLLFCQAERAVTAPLLLQSPQGALPITFWLMILSFPQGKKA